jgi:ElaB/YqjD/DUF883 family membrane-anchored ribosome-binding protein
MAVDMMTKDALDEAAYAAKRSVDKSVQRGLDTLEDLKDESIRYVKHHPVQTVAVAAGIGIVLGVAAGWLARSITKMPAKG